MANVGDLYASGSYHISTNGFANYLLVTGTKAVQSILYGCDGYNNSAAQKYLFVFDTNALPSNAALPIAGAALIHIFPMPANSAFSGASAIAGGEGYYLKGIFLAVSTTVATFTVDTASTSFISAQYGTTI